MHLQNTSPFQNQLMKRSQGNSHKENLGLESNEPSEYQLKEKIMESFPGWRPLQLHSCSSQVTDYVLGTYGSLSCRTLNFSYGESWTWSQFQDL